MVKKHLAASVIAGLTVAALSFGTANSEPLKDKTKDGNNSNTETRYKNSDAKKTYKHKNTNWNNGNNGNKNRVHAVPEPGTLLLIGSALGGIALASRGLSKED